MVLLRRGRWGVRDNVYALGFKDLLLQGNSDLKVFFCQKGSKKGFFFFKEKKTVE